MRKFGGKQPGAGRKKGTLGTSTIQLKEAVLKAFDEVGGHKYLVELASSQPAIFCALLGKLIPRDIKADITTRSLDVKLVNYAGLSDKELESVEDSINNRLLSQDSIIEHNSIN